MGYETNYGGKPDGTITIHNDGNWYRLDADTKDPAHTGAEVQEMYGNFKCYWQEPDAGVWNLLMRVPVVAPLADRLRWVFTPAGVIRVKYVRENGDETAYDDICVPSRRNRWLATRAHHEKGQAGQGGRWWLKVEGGINYVVVGTRYSKNQVAF